MIEFVYGFLQEKELDYVVIDVSGLGYKVHIPNNLFPKLPSIKEQIKLYTHFVHKEDSMELYGFFNMREREVFRHLLTVSGVGPKLGMKILSHLNSSDVIRFVLNKDSNALTQVSGLGKKGSEKIILELQNKFKKLYPYPLDPESEDTYSIDKISVDALLALGYREKEVLEAVRLVMQKEKPKTTEDIITLSLKILANIY